MDLKACKSFELSYEILISSYNWFKCNTWSISEISNRVNRQSFFKLGFVCPFLAFGVVGAVPQVEGRVLIITKYC